MSERWKPGRGEFYYFLDGMGNTYFTKYEPEDIGAIRHAYGNCFATEAEARAAAEKVQALLLSLHNTTQDEQLPKLTTEVFNRPDCPNWAKWAAVDSNGAGFYYSEKPFIMSDAFGWGIVCSETNHSELIGGEFNNSDWQNSLIERPATLPDWCKVGEWVYLSNEEYDKIESIDDFGINLASGAIIKKKYIPEEAVSARLRPYNADELRGLVGKTIATKEDCAIVTGYRGCENKIILTMEHNRYSAEELLKINATLNGKPCGKLEHLENGEWVE